MANPASQKILQNQLKELKTNPIFGFAVDLADESNIYNWKVFIQGPPDTPYETGIFQAELEFPVDYPYSPPVMKFTSDFWHPNVYQDGKVCISILHPPGHDPLSGELPEERWLPTQTPETILLSVISLLSDPNTASPANVDANIEWMRKREGYKLRCKKLIEKANKELPEDFEMPKPKPYKKQQQFQEDILDSYYGREDEFVLEDFEEEGDAEEDDEEASYHSSDGGDNVSDNENQ